MKYWIQLLFILLAIPLGFAQQASIVLSIDQYEVEIGTPIIITVKTNIKGDLVIDFPSNFKPLPGMTSGRTKQIDFKTGKSETIYFTTRTGSFLNEGKFNFRAEVKNGKKNYKSNSVTIRVEKKAVVASTFTRKETNKPVFGTVEVQQKTIYEGESILVNGKIYSKYDLAIEGYETYKITGYPDVKELSSPKEPVFIPIIINGQQYFQTPFDSKVLFYSSPGKYEIGPFKMSVVYETSDDFINFEVKSNKEVIEVLPLPANAPQNFTGGIGEFNFTRNFDLVSVNQGDVVVMTVEIEGQGNINNITKPEFSLPEGVILYGDPEVSEVISYLQSGARGKKTYKFLLQFVDKGNFSIPEMEISFFNPKDKKYFTRTSKAVEVQVAKSNHFQNQVVDNSELRNDITVSREDGKQNKDRSKVSLVLLSVFLPISLGAFLFFFLKRRPKKEVENIVEIVKENKDMHKIASLLEHSSLLQRKQDFEGSYQQLKLAIRTMVRLVTEEFNQIENQEKILQELSEILVLIETARFLDVFDLAEAQAVQKQAQFIFHSIQ